ncbi:uncharacterized protein LOC125375874 [Haliotis rufescens]|uniref:uncharacterized protein LOC125375874 n=1 Tax=Haliotis rufescens TaxID=6454 RepID=UPI00201F329B|nr:uncharacterized protein LOC125375874 [Haliotis rufescens]
MQIIFIMSLSATIWSRLTSQIPMRRTAISKTRTIVKLPHGLANNGLDRRTNLVNPIAVQETIYQSRKFLMHEQNEGMQFLNAQELEKNNNLHLLTGEFSIAKEMYNPSPKYPAEIECKLASYGKSSILCEFLMRSPDVSHPIAVVKDKAVLVSDSFTEVCPLPEIWKERFGSYYKKADIWFEPFATPSHMICRGAQVKPFVLTVPRRDEGTYGYVTSTMLLQYCLDALGDHFCRNKIHCEENKESLFLKNASYHITAFAGVADTLTVELWDDDTYSDGVCFNILKSGNSVFQSRIQFYSYGDLQLQDSHA